MDFINQLLETVKSAPNPELYYLIAAVVLIVVFYLIHKLLKLMIFCLIVTVLGLGFSLIQNGGDVNALITSLTSTFESAISGTKSSGSTTSSNSSKSSGTMQNLISDMLSKFKSDSK